VHRDALARVLADERIVETQDGERLSDDALVLALGARPAEAVRGALTFRGPQDAERLRHVVAALRDGTIRRVAFIVRTGTTWALPLYELALQTAAAVADAAPGAQREARRHDRAGAGRRDLQPPAHERGALRMPASRKPTVGSRSSKPRPSSATRNSTPPGS
jgi:hypothetical protein